MKPEAIYRGIRTDKGCLVTCDNAELPARTDIRSLSNTGFEWGLESSGSGQLALAILADFCGDEQALDLYQDFQRDIIAPIGSSRWEMKAPMLIEWVRKRLKERKHDAQQPAGHFT
jgi:hypothetical protein